jgi:hypothetical protein
MSNLTLNKVEIAMLKGAVRRGDSDQNFNELLMTLDGLLNEKSGQMYVSQNTLDLIQKFGLGPGTRTWRAILHGVFARSLGDQFGRVQDESGKLTEREPPKRSSRQPT